MRRELREAHHGDGFVSHTGVVDLVQVFSAKGRNLAGKATVSSSQVPLEQCRV